MNSDLTIDIWGKGNASCSSSSFSSSSSSKSEAVLGIDLGTSTSCMAIWDKSKSRAKIIKNSHGCRVTPSIICKDKCTGELTLGGSNTTNSSDKTINVICNWKRLLLEPSVEDIQHAKCYHSFIMRYLKQCAEEYLEKKPKLGNQFIKATNSTDRFKIERVVIGVPVTYAETSVEATKQAAFDAGFKEVVVMHESMAAAAAYGLMVAGTKNAMVCNIYLTHILILSLFDSCIVFILQNCIRIYGSGV